MSIEYSMILADKFRSTRTAKQPNLLTKYFAVKSIACQAPVIINKNLQVKCWKLKKCA